MRALVNGARVAIFAILTLVAVDDNYAQTRKSPMTRHAEGAGQELDTDILTQVTSLLQVFEAKNLFGDCHQRHG